MKNISLLLFYVSLFFSIKPVGQAQTFYKLYGNPSEDNYPTKVKGYNGFTYVISTRKVPATPNTPAGDYATFSKFSNTGVLSWEYQLNIPSQLLDFEYCNNDQSFLLVGRTEPIQTAAGAPQDNQSLLVKIIDNGATATLAFSRKYQHTGRESFTRIIRTTQAGNTHEFYVLGFKDTGPPINNVEQVILYNFDCTASTPRFAKEYSSQYKAHIGIFAKANGNVVLLGATTPANDGLLIEINGTTGIPVTGFRYNDVNNTKQYDFNDGMELPNGQIVIAGTDILAQKAVLLTLNSSFAPLFGRIFDNISEFRELGRDPNGNALSELLYTVGPAKQALDYPVVTRVSTNFSAFTVIYSAYYYQGETGFKNPHFSVTPATNRIFYADSREVSAGNYDMLIGAFDLNFSIQSPVNNCRTLFTNPTTALTLRQTAVTVVEKSLTQTIIDMGALVSVLMTQKAFCPASSCNATFTQTMGSCLDLHLIGTGTSNGSGPLTYSWSVNNGQFVSTLQNPTFNLPAAGSYNVCLTVSDASINCSTTNCQIISVQAPAPPACVIPSNITVNTDAGKCYAFLSPQVSGIGCPPLVITTTLSGATTGTVLATNYNKGVTTVTVVIKDGFNNSTTCTFTVTVIDKELPKFICPQNVNINAPFCNLGAIVTFPPPTVTDNCPMSSFTCTHQSGAFFPCGKTIVNCKATDMSNNTSSCTFEVNVNCQCAAIGATTIVCDPVIDDKYLFTIAVNSLSGSPSCTASVSGTIPGGVITASPITFTNSGVISGMITITGGVIPTTFNLSVNVQCSCTNGVVSNCTLPVVLTPVCCKRISIADQSICATDGQVQVPLLGCGQFSSLQLVNWYVATGPTCPPFPGFTPPSGSGWVLQQGSFDCSQLLLFPYLYTDNIWIKAVITVGDFPCTVIASNIASLTLCKPSGCNINLPYQEFCYTGLPINALMLTAAPNIPTTSNCPVSVTLWTGDGVPVGQTGSTYTPTGLTLPTGFTGCYKDFTYTSTVNSKCGNQTCTATVRIFNNAADLGTLQMNPNEMQPFCPGEDATMEFIPNCASKKPPMPAMWQWFVSTTSSTTGFLPLAGSGDMNPLWNTNQLFQDHWYQVQSQNGVCIAKDKTYFIDVRDPLSIVAFTATPIMTTPDCDVTGVKLGVFFLPAPADPLCPIKITWIKNGQVLFSSNYPSSPAVFIYTDPTLQGDYSGNYWAIVERTCCNEKIKSNLITIDPPCFLKLTGPCYLRQNGTATLTGQLINPPSSPVTCSSQWFILVGSVLTPVGLPNANTITVNTPGNYVYQVTCSNGCIKKLTFPLTLCLNDCTTPTIDIGEKTYTISIFPNPNIGSFTIKLPAPAQPGIKFHIVALNGKLVLEKQTEVGNTLQSVEASKLPDGLYFIYVISDGKVIAVEKFVKQ